MANQAKWYIAGVFIVQSAIIFIVSVCARFLLIEAGHDNYFKDGKCAEIGTPFANQRHVIAAGDMTDFGRAAHVIHAASAA